MHRRSWPDRLRYAFDNYMARGTIALVGGLFVASALVILVVALAIQLLGLAAGHPETERLGFFDLLWRSLLRTLDPGTMGADRGGGPFLLSMLLVTLGGIFIISTLIGILSTGIDAKLTELRKGRSRVMESDHTVILGWSQQVFSMVDELVLANANRRRACIVVLADRDKVEMEDLLRERIARTGRVRIVCRSGSPIDLDEIDIASPQTSRAIIVLSPEGDDPDADVIKTLLAITNDPNRRKEPYHVVAEIRNPQNLEVARMVGRDEVELVLVGELIARITAQACRQSGLSIVYNELLDFTGDEIYFTREERLAGRSFGEALMAYEGSAVIGLRPSGAPPVLNPPMETLIGSDDELVVIAEDDDTIRLSEDEPVVDEDLVQPAIRRDVRSERTLLLGWNWRAPSIVRELDHYVAPGSAVMVCADVSEAASEVEALAGETRNLDVSFRLGHTDERRTLDALQVETYDHVIILCYSDLLDAQRADARTLVTLLHLRDIASRGGHRFSIVSEMLDMRNRSLAEVTRVDDFIVSGRLVSLVMSQIAENKQLNAVFRDLFDSGGSAVYLKPASDYVQLHAGVTFYTVVEAARRRGEVAFGYRLRRDRRVPGPAGEIETDASSRAGAHDAERDAAVAAASGVVVNPPKARQLFFGEDDRVIVLAES